MPKGKNIAFLFLILTTSIWGSLYVVTKIVLATTPPLTLLLLRYIIASVVLFFLLTITTKNKENLFEIIKQDWKIMLYIGFVGYFLSVGAQNLGTKYAGASTASLINAMNPVSILFFASIVLKEKLTLPKVVGIAAALIGTYIVLGRPDAKGAVWGIGFSVASVILWSFSSILVRKISSKYSPLMITAWGILIAMIFSIPTSIIELQAVPHSMMFSVQNILCFLYLGIICTAVPNVLWNKSLSMLEAGTCSLFYPVQPLVSVGLGILILHETIDLMFMAGACCIIGGILFAIVFDKKTKGRIS